MTYGGPMGGAVSYERGTPAPIASPETAWQRSTATRRSTKVSGPPHFGGDETKLTPQKALEVTGRRQAHF